MKVSVKELNAAIELKTKGMALEVLDNNGALQGSLIVTGTGVVWCKGKSNPDKGVKISWTKLIESFANTDVKPKAKPAAKAVPAKSAKTIVEKSKAPVAKPVAAKPVAKPKKNPVKKAAPADSGDNPVQAS